MHALVSSSVKSFLRTNRATISIHHTEKNNKAAMFCDEIFEVYDLIILFNSH